MKLFNVKLIFLREVRDQLRDRRTLFTIAVLPLLLYPLLGMVFFQVAQFLKQHPTKILVLGDAELKQPRIEIPKLIEPAAKEGEYRFVEQFCISEKERELLRLKKGSELPGGELGPDVIESARELVESGQYDAVIHFPPNFAERLRRFREESENGANGESKDDDREDDVPNPNIYYNTAKDKSRMAHDRVQAVLVEWRRALVRQNLKERNVPKSAAEPFKLKTHDLAKREQKQAAVWSKILPFVLLIWALTGAFYPAVDLCAGEKERGTLETLLSSPAQRSEIVWGKLLAVMIFSMATSILNLACMGLTGAFLIGQMKHMGHMPFGLEIGPPPLASMGWLLLALLPISALFSALALAIAALARSTKEGQYYLMPLLLITMPLMMVPIFPAARLDLGNSLIPVTGMMLLLRTLMEGQYVEALRYAAPVLGVTAACCLLAIRWAIDQFNDESVLFRESERLDLGLWFRHAIRDRSDTPTVALAIMCGLLLLLIRFFAGMTLPTPNSWGLFVQVMLVGQIAMIATPVLLMTIMLTGSPRKTLLLKAPPWLSIPAAVALALAIHPVAISLSEAVKWLYPFSEEAIKTLEPINRAVAAAPSIWHILLVLALLPAICEELAFRGFILSGLRHMGHKWGAILLSAVFFGVTHFVLQQSITAVAVGVVIGYLAVQTGSLLPGVLFHLLHNSLVVLAGQVTTKMLQDHRVLALLFSRAEDGYMYNSWVVGVAGVATIFLLLWFRRLPHRLTPEESLKKALKEESLHAGSS